MASVPSVDSGMVGLNPSKVQARKMVLISILLLFLIQVYRDRKSETPSTTFHKAWATSVVGMFLSLLADFVPQIAGPFAGLIVLGSLTHGGEQALEKALGVIAPNTSGMSNDPVHDAADRRSAGSSSSSSSTARSGSGSSSGPPATVTHTAATGP